MNEIVPENEALEFWLWHSGEMATRRDLKAGHLAAIEETEAPNAADRQECPSDFPTVIAAGRGDLTRHLS